MVEGKQRQDNHSPEGFMGNSEKRVDLRRASCNFLEDGQLHAIGQSISMTNQGRKVNSSQKEKG